MKRVNLAIAMVALVAVAGVSVRSVADDATSRLVLPGRSPEGLAFEGFEKLGPNWQDWSAETVALIDQVFTSQSDEAQQAAIAAVRERIEIIDVALNDSRYRKIHTHLADIRGKLLRRLDLYDALRVLLDSEGQNAEDPTRALRDLTAAVDYLEQRLERIPQGNQWLPYVQAAELRTIAADGTLTEDERALLTTVSNRLNAEDLERRQQLFLQQPMFRDLAGAIRRVLTTVPTEADGSWKERAVAQSNALIQTLEEYNASGSRLAASQARDAFEQLEALGGSAAWSLKSAMRTHYFNFNMHVAASEGFLSRFISDHRSESGRILERVDDIQIYGCQWTNTSLGVNVLPSANGIRFDLVLDGDVRMQTTADAGAATVYNAGWARFRAEKEIVYDGQFSLSPTRVAVNASNNSYDAETCLEWVPLVRGIARNIALSRAADKKPQADAQTRNKIGREVGERLDRETAQEFANAQGKLNRELIRPLQDINLYPELLSYSSTSHEAIIRGRLLGPGELGGDRPPRVNAPDRGVLIQIHQSLLSNGADRMEFAGEVLSAEEMNAKIESRLKTVFPKRDFSRERPADDDNTQFIFDEHDPISFALEDGAIIMSLKAGLQRPGEEDIPTQIISVPLLLSLEGDQLVMTRGRVGVKPAERPRRVSEQIVRARIMIGKIEKTIPERTTRDATVRVEQQGKVVTLKVRTLDAEDGWLSVTAE